MSAYEDNQLFVNKPEEDLSPHSKKDLTYENWRQGHESILSDFKDKTIIMLFTGGKDSSLILDYLQKASQEFGFSFQAHGADYPHKVFTDEEKAKLARYWQRRGIDIVWHPIPESDSLIEEALNDGTNPCYVCHKVKRRCLKSFVNGFHQGAGKEMVIILSYTLWDLVSYSIEYITGSIYGDPDHSNLFQGKSAETRFAETSQRFYPIIRLDGGPTIFKPLLKYNDLEIAHAVETAGIPLSSVKCKYVDYRPKRLLSQYYGKLGLYFDYDKLYKFAEKALGLRDMDYYRDLDKNQFLERLV